MYRVWWKDQIGFRTVGGPVTATRLVSSCRPRSGLAVQCTACSVALKPELLDRPASGASFFRCLSPDISGKIHRDEFRKNSEASRRRSRRRLWAKVIGVLDAQSSRLNAFSQLDIFTLQTLADQLAIAVENARLYEQASREISQRKEAEKQKEELIGELQQALARVKSLSGLLPICSSCKRIRDDRGYWNQIEAYVREHSQADFSHGFCPECLKKLYPEYSPKDPE